MEHTLDECRWLYNHFLEERKNAWEQNNQSISMYDQIKTLPKLKQERPSLSMVHSQIFQNVAVRIDLAFKSFFRRVKAGEKPGYPRFRGTGWYDSFTYTQSGFSIDGRLRLSKIGDVKIRLHRPIEGGIKTLTISRSPTGKWYACFSCEVEPEPLPECNEAVGIDVAWNPLLPSLLVKLSLILASSGLTKRYWLKHRGSCPDWRREHLREERLKRLCRISMSASPIGDLILPINFPIEL